MLCKQNKDCINYTLIYLTKQYKEFDFAWNLEVSRGERKLDKDAGCY